MKRYYHSICKIILSAIIFCTLFLSGCEANDPGAKNETCGKSAENIEIIISSEDDKAIDAASEAEQEHSDIDFTVVNSPEHAKNIILFIGDGMGFEQISLGRILKENDPLSMDTMKNIGCVSTHYDNDNKLLVTDSAASATAIACGVKTKKYAVGVDKDGNAVRSIMSYAKDAGKSTGLITTTRITDATTAAFAAHNTSRSNEEQTAVDLLHAVPDILMGGGKKNFLPDRRKDGTDLIAQSQTQGYSLLYNREEMLNTNATMLLGLFASDKMPYTVDNDTQAPSIKDMTIKALDVLSKNPEGFFVMIEGGRIDHSCHANDAVTTAYEVMAFDEAVGAALEFAQKNTDTLVIVTADHETGGLTIGIEKSYSIGFDTLLKVQTGSIFENIVPNADSASGRLDYSQFVRKQFGIRDLSRSETDALKTAFSSNDRATIGNALAALITQRSNIKWASRDHSGKNVPVMAYGPYAKYFTGYIDNTDIFKIMMDAMGIEGQG